MARWKMAGHLAVAMKEAEKQAEQRRIQEEQFQESIRNGNILRKLARQHVCDSSKAMLAVTKTKKMVKVLNTEATEATSDATVARSNHFKQEDGKYRHVLKDNVSGKDAATKLVKRLKEEIAILRMKDKDLDKEIWQVRVQLRAMKNEMDSMHVVGPDKVLRRQEVLHHSYGHQLEEIRHLRDQIEHLEHELVKVTAIKQELERECQRLSKELHTFTEEAKSTYEQRDLSCLSMVKLKEHMDKSSTAYESDNQLLEFKISVLQRMELFMTTKNKFRVDEGRDRRSRMRSQVSTIEKDSANFETLLRKVYKGLGQKDVQLIIKTFNEMQEENYMLFRNISETRQASHSMSVEIEQMKAKLASIRQSRQHSEHEAFTRKLELMERTENSKKESEAKEQYIEKADQVIATYIQGVLTMLEKLGYTQDDIKRIAGVFECVEERNILEFLAELEHHINKIYDLGTMIDFVVYDKARKSPRPPLPPDPLPPRLAILQSVVVVPPHHDASDDVDDAALPTEAAFRPLDLKEIGHYVGEDLEARGRRDELGVPLPCPNMKDSTSAAIGDTPQLPLKAIGSVDIF